MYLGACQECKARITDATMENNALGYSGSNSGGSLVIEHSIFRHNSVGVAPNSENPGDGPPPQDGECNRPNIETPETRLPEITSTEIKRCTIIRNNLITENNNLTTPANGSTDGAPFGVGVELPGDYADAIEENEITNNPNDGVLAFEYPNPFPPTAETIFFQNSGNKVANNTFSGNGKLGNARRSKATSRFEGGLFGQEKSVNNCVSGNSFAGNTFPKASKGNGAARTKPRPTRAVAAGGRIPAVPAGTVGQPHRSGAACAAGSGNDAEPVPRSPAEPAVPIGS